MSEPTSTEEMYAQLGLSALEQAKEDASFFGVGCVLILANGSQLTVTSVDCSRIRLEGRHVIIDAAEVIAASAQVDPAAAEIQTPTGERIFVANVIRED